MSHYNQHQAPGIYPAPSAPYPPPAAAYPPPAHAYHAAPPAHEYYAPPPAQAYFPQPGQVYDAHPLPHPPSPYARPAQPYPASPYAAPTPVAYPLCCLVLLLLFGYVLLRILWHRFSEGKDIHTALNSFCDATKENFALEISYFNSEHLY
ncbi:hypothetical protein RJ640_005791 [Escallonia rubra]|uniref:Uncharacterized protein n=1 Tax=Escallonia rubra TaxID=112253 RepID=A0AA88UHN4_9ASTE|nr:hypothetical protein RJ640_005791 [Escallonia rubra]